MNGIIDKTKSSIDDLKLDTVPCVVCKESIRNGAKKCTNCDSFQGWLSRRLNLSGTILSLLVALVSVSAFAIPIIRTSLFPDADIRATVVGSQQNFMQIVLTNVGTRAGTFKGARVKMPNGSGWPLERIQNSESKAYVSSNRTVYTPPVFEGQVIKPGEIVTMIFASDRILPTLKSKSEKWALEYFFVQFDGTLSNKESIFFCESEKEVGQDASNYHPLLTRKPR